MVMRRNITTGNLKSRIQTARNYYAKHDALPLYDHCHKVLRIARENSIDGDVITEGILHHIIKNPKNINTSKFELPEALNNKDVLTVIEAFNGLSRLNANAAPVADYRELITGMEAELATMAVLMMVVDYAVTHAEEKHLENFINPDGHPIFRLYPSRRDALETLEMDAKAGEKIWAPAAERLGHPPLAGSILKHAYEVNHSDIHSFVMEKLREDEMQVKLEATRTMVRNLARRIRRTLKGAGFSDVKVSPRLEKHPGKIMRKVYRRIEEFYKKTESEKEMSLQEYIERNLHQFDLLRLHDLVAMRAVINKVEGREIDRMEDSKKNVTIELAVKHVETNIDALPIVAGSKYEYKTEHVTKEDVGYDGRHVDSCPVNGSNTVRFEVQIKTEKQHWIAEKGGAAHWRYLAEKGGYEQLIEDLMDIPNGNGNGVESMEDRQQLVLPIE